MATVPSIPAISHLAYNSERELLTAYVRAGYQYTVIIQFLSTFHDLPMSLRTLKNRLHAYGIQRRVNPTAKVSGKAAEAITLYTCFESVRGLFYS